MLDCAQPDDYCLHENESNLGLGLRLRPPDRKFFYTAGFYRNSLDRNSVYAGAGAQLFSAGPVSLRVIGGMVTGYNVQIVPMVIPEVAIGGRWKAAFSYLPEIEMGGAGKVDEVFSFSVIRQF